MRIALYGGTFDPIHHGHLILARDAVERLGLDQLVFVPNAISPHKTDRVTVSGEIRLEMIRAAIEGEPRFAVDDCELRREPPSYTIDTVRHFRSRLQPDDQLFYLIGADNLRELHTWKQVDELVQLTQFVVFRRDGVGERPATLDYPMLERCVEISATEIRHRIAKGLSIRYLVPDAVGGIIAAKELYQEKTH